MKYILQIIIFFIFIHFSFSQSSVKEGKRESFDRFTTSFMQNLYSDKDASYNYLKEIEQISKNDTNSILRLDYLFYKWRYALNYGEIQLSKKTLNNLLFKIRTYSDNTQAKYLNDIASVYSDYQMFDLSEQYFRYVLNLKGLSIPSEEYVTALNGVSDFLRMKNDMDSAKIVSLKALEMSKKLNITSLYVNAFQKYINIYFTLLQMDSIDIKIQKYHVKEYFNNYHYESIYYNILAYYYYLKNDLDSAIYYSRLVVKSRANDNNRVNYYSALNNLGRMFMEHKQYDSAYYYLEAMKDSLARTKTYSIISRNIEFLENLYKINNDSVKLKEFENYKYYIDSVNKIQIEKINMINRLYKTSNKLEESQKKNQDYQFLNTILITLTILITAFIVFYIYYNVKLKDAVKNQQILIKDKINTLKELEIEVNNKNKLISLLSHDLINPINSSSQLLELLKNEFYSMNDTEKYEIILELSRASVNTYDLLKDILNWMKISQHNLYKFNPTEFRIFNLVQNIYEYLHLQLDNKNQILINNINRNHIISADSNLMSTILRNLISNASKYSDSHKKITLYSYLTESNYIIVIEDEGIGMKKEQIDALESTSYNSILSFERVEENSFGYGVVICKDFMHAHNGKLHYESDGKTGTRAKLIFNKSTLIKDED